MAHNHPVIQKHLDKACHQRRKRPKRNTIADSNSQVTIDSDYDPAFSGSYSTYKYEQARFTTNGYTNSTFKSSFQSRSRKSTVITTGNGKGSCSTTTSKLSNNQLYKLQKKITAEREAQREAEAWARYAENPTHFLPQERTISVSRSNRPPNDIGLGKNLEQDLNPCRCGKLFATDLHRQQCSVNNSAYHIKALEDIFDQFLTPRESLLIKGQINKILDDHDALDESSVLTNIDLSSTAETSETVLEPLVEEPKEELESAETQPSQEPEEIERLPKVVRQMLPAIAMKIVIYLIVVDHIMRSSINFARNNTGSKPKYCYSAKGSLCVC